MATARPFLMFTGNAQAAMDLYDATLPDSRIMRVERYARARDRVIERNPDVLGGTAVIRDTRISVYALLGRIESGDSVESIIDDYPEMDRETIETAITYARTHPLVGRPGGRPWAKAS